ncbi:DUF4153 domain-containing protein [Thalassotalea crassostreae]|uniref:DUF4153 domain-containing protein n=1 Tax=Thalassotalea crassostreae TaxID=1763536 RepID=UPI000837DF73|nr:DUF4153 domain-containing protein [Thalassotalea crassostreae]
MENQLPKPLMLVMSLIQGILLAFIYRSAEEQFWPGNDPVWLMALATFTIAFPLLTLLTITRQNLKASITYILPFTIVISLLAAYVGFQQTPVEYINNSYVVFVFSWTILIASFKALMYIQQLNSGEKITYSSLFKYSWRNAIIFAESLLFTLIFWGILHLGAGLFSVLEINIFKEVLEKDWFVIPTLTFAFGFAIVVFRNITHTVDTIAKILQTLIKFLLPVITIVSIGFLATLPFTGLEKLWGTGSGSLLVLWLQALTLFFVNAVYQEAAHERPYNLIVHRVIFIGVALLPIYTLIASYGLWLRVDQYGLTVSRLWGILTCALLGTFAIGYLIGIIKRKDAWLETLSTVNIRMGLAVLLVMLLINSPVLNFQAISASSQIAMLKEKTIKVDDFDFYYFGQNLGRQGYLQMQQVKEEIGNEHPDKVAVIDRMYTRSSFNKRKYGNKEQDTLADFEKLITYWPNKESFPEDLTVAVFNSATEQVWSTIKDKNYYFISIDMNEDHTPDIVVISEHNYSTTARLWLLEDEKWQSKYMKISNPSKNKFLKSLIEQSEIQVTKPQWQTLNIGDMKLKVQL